MQAYVHKDGKNLGPYTVRELRSRVDDGILLPDDLACHDGQNWVKISQIPGFESSIPPPPPPQEVTNAIAATLAKNLCIPNPFLFLLSSPLTLSDK